MATNVAAASNGGVATASSTINTDYAAANAIDGDRTGATWGVDGGWNDGTASIFDDWFQVDFSGSNSINEIDVFSIQDNFNAPATPTLSMTCGLYGLRDFEVQYWTGSAWSTVTGGNVSGNTKVWRQFTFTPVTTTKVRVLVHASQDGLYSRIAEVEAWLTAVPGTPTSPSPADAATGVSTMPTLSWSGPGATTFDVKFNTFNPPTTVVSAGQASSSYTPATLSPLTTYFWRIVGINSSGSTTGPVWSFTTAAVVVGGIKPTVVIEVELSGEGAGWTNLGAGGAKDVETKDGVRIRYGMPGGGPDDNVAPSGSALFTLNNSAGNSQAKLGLYSLYNANKLAGWALDIRCRITFVDPATGTASVQFIGKIDSIDPAPGKKLSRAARVAVIDWMDEAANWAITAAVGEQIDKRWEQVLSAIIAQMPTVPTATNFDAGADSYPVSLDSSAFSTQQALSEFKKLADSERGLVYIKGDGTLKAEGRHARLVNTTSLWTLPETDIVDLSLPSTRAEVIDTVRTIVHPRVIDENPTTIVYNQANSIEIPALGDKLLLGSFRDQVTGDPIGATDLQALIASTDYLGNTAEDGSGTDITSDFTITLQVGQSGINATVANANALTGFLTLFQIRGKGIKNKSSQQLQATSGAGKHVVVLDMPYQGNADVGQGAADYYLAKYNTAFAQARRVGVVGRTSALLTQILTRDISDRITISETVTGLNNDFFINGVEKTLLPSGQLMATYILAPAADPFSGLYWVLGTSTLWTDTRPAPL